MSKILVTLKSAGDCPQFPNSFKGSRELQVSKLIDIIRKKLALQSYRKWLCVCVLFILI